MAQFIQPFDGGTHTQKMVALASEIDDAIPDTRASKLGVCFLAPPLCPAIEKSYEVRIYNKIKFV